MTNSQIGASVVKQAHCDGARVRAGVDDELLTQRGEFEAVRRVQVESGSLLGAARSLSTSSVG